MKKVLVVSPMSLKRSAYFEFSLEGINVNDEGVEQTAKDFSSGIVAFFLNLEDHKPWSPLKLLTGSFQK